jgi:Protein of unknown function (DUF3096)
MDLGHLQHLPLEALLAVIVGVLVLLVPRVLNYAIAAYLIVVGTLGLLHGWSGYYLRPQAVAALVAGVLTLARPALLNYAVGIYLIFIGVLELGLVRL